MFHLQRSLSRVQVIKEESFLFRQYATCNVGALPDVNHVPSGPFLHEKLLDAKRARSAVKINFDSVLFREATRHSVHFEDRGPVSNRHRPFGLCGFYEFIGDPKDLRPCCSPGLTKSITAASANADFGKEQRSNPVLVLPNRSALLIRKTLSPVVMEPLSTHWENKIPSPDWPRLLFVECTRRLHQPLHIADGIRVPRWPNSVSPAPCGVWSGVITPSKPTSFRS